MKRMSIEEGLARLKEISDKREEKHLEAIRRANETDNPRLRAYMRRMLLKRSVSSRMMFTRTSRRLGEHVMCYRRSFMDVPFAGKVLGSFTCAGGGGYIVQRDDSGNIVQAQSVTSFYEV